MSKAKRGTALDELQVIAQERKRGTGCTVCKVKPAVLEKLDELIRLNLDEPVTTWNAICDHVRDRYPDPAFPRTNPTLKRHLERCRGISL